jgi:hypothetical protein
MEGVINLYQSHVMIRYQTRAAVKIMTSSSFLLVTLAAMYSRTRFQPRFNPLFAVDEEESSDNNDELRSGYLLAGLVFFVTDVAEWLFLTFGVLLRHTRAPVDKLRLCCTVLLDPITLLATTFNTLFLACFMFHMAWPVYDGEADIQRHVEHMVYGTV